MPVNAARTELLRRAKGLTIIVSDEQLQKEQEQRLALEEGYVPIPERLDGCYSCHEPATRVDSNARLWCSQHAPQGCQLHNTTSFLATSVRAPVDLRYIPCKWYNPKFADGPASQGLEYALQRDFFCMGLQWYTPYLQNMFRDNPGGAIEWVTLTRKFHAAHDRQRLAMMASQIFAYNVPHYKEPVECYRCHGAAQYVDKHERHWCEVHAPSGLVSASQIRFDNVEDSASNMMNGVSVAIDNLEAIPVASSSVEDIEICSACKNIAVGYDPETGNPLCSLCLVETS